MTKMLRLTSLVVLFLITEPASARLQEVREVHYQMGTFLAFTMWHSDPELARRLLRVAVQDVHRLEGILSNFDPDSAVSKFNRQAGKGKMRLPPDLYELLTMAKDLSGKTAGYFDVTVGPLVDVWRHSLSMGELPARDKLMWAMQQVGYDKLKLSDQGAAELIVPGMKIDLGGIGKGYAVDRIADRFKVAGINSALINFGGSSMAAIGTPPGKLGWEIGIQGASGEVRGVICLRDMALSTSGSLGRLWIVGGKKYGHLIDPNNGLPVSESRMVTVITSTAVAAEALTKPLALIGGKALSFVGHFPQSEAVIFSEHGASLFSKGFKAKALWRKVSTT